MADYSVAPAAKADLREIGRYTQSQWGKPQRRIYLSALRLEFRAIVDRKHLGLERNELKKGLLSHLCQKHVIFFRRIDNDVEIIRILSQRQSAEKAFNLDSTR